MLAERLDCAVTQIRITLKGYPCTSFPIGNDGKYEAIKFVRRHRPNFAPTSSSVIYAQRTLTNLALQQGTTLAYLTS